MVDNSSAFRRDETIPLVVPEINGHALIPRTSIVANPNCSTIQMVMVLAPLHRAFGLDRVVVSTSQSITGTGVRAVRQYEMERNVAVFTRLPLAAGPLVGVALWAFARRARRP